MPARMPVQFAAAILVIVLSGSAFSDEFDKGLAAYDRGDYATALSNFRKAAEQGDAAAQFYLGNMYGNGNGIPKNYKQAIYWYAKAVEQGNADAQLNLGGMYRYGNGIPKDYVMAYMWLNLAASQGDDVVRAGREMFERSMTPEQVAEAQRLTREWKSRQETGGARQKSSKSALDLPQPVSSGTGFYVSAEGHVLTNEHVIGDCSFLGVEPIGKPPVTAQVVAKDARNDLAVILSREKGVRFAQIRSGGVRQGERVVVYGFPLSGAIASTGNATTGNVSALSGIQDDTRMLQISAPVQPGNSGGPLIDMSGAVVGIVVSKLNAAKVMEITGDIPQNINFSLKANIAKSFLESHGIKYKNALKGRELSVPDVADAARKFTVRVLCYQ